jgi:hypothetical protein
MASPVLLKLEASDFPSFECPAVQQQLGSSPGHVLDRFGSASQEDYRSTLRHIGNHHAKDTAQPLHSLPRQRLLRVTGRNLHLPGQGITHHSPVERITVSVLQFMPETRSRSRLLQILGGKYNHCYPFLIDHLDLFPIDPECHSQSRSTAGDSLTIHQNSSPVGAFEQSRFASTVTKQSQLRIIEPYCAG